MNLGNILCDRNQSQNTIESDFFKNMNVQNRQKVDYCFSADSSGDGE